MLLPFYEALLRSQDWFTPSIYNYVMPHNFHLFNCSFVTEFENKFTNQHDGLFWMKTNEDLEILLMQLDSLKNHNLGVPIFGCEDWFEYEDYQ